MPVASYPGAQLTGARVRDLVSRADAQVEAILALQERLKTTVRLTCMDLSAEAEAFGATLHQGDDEVPSITGRRVTSLAEAQSLPLPEVGAARTCVQLEVVRRLVADAPATPVIAGVTGPFSLAARLLGVSETMVLTVQDPGLVHAVLERCAAFLRSYVTTLRDAGAAGIFMAEPTAGLISPRALAEYSAPYVQGIQAEAAAPGFTLILHNCAAKPAHLAAILASGAQAYHFGAPMDLRAALQLAAGEILVFGNLDPTAVFLQATPAEVTQLVRQRISEVGMYPNYVLSSGCDLPRGIPLANLEAFLAAAAERPRSGC